MVKLSENDGVQNFRPLNPPLAVHFPGLTPHLFLLIMNHFFYNLSVVVWVSDDAESIYETLKVPRSGYNRLPVTIDIGHKSQGHYHGSGEPSHIVSLSMFFWAR